MVGDRGREGIFLSLFRDFSSFIHLYRFLLLSNTRQIDEGKVESEKHLANEEIVAQLVSMGFNHLHCQKAAINTSNAGVEEAMNWLLSHMDDPDIDVPISQEAENAEALSFVDQSKVDTLISFGFQEDISRKVLRALIKFQYLCFFWGYERHVSIFLW
uniref:ubiquitinyl hydrolase 1 n=1 Tax=Vitis vinifera TaxID=29760 RepID=F6HTI8_VITVI